MCLCRDWGKSMEEKRVWVFPTGAWRDWSVNMEGEMGMCVQRCAEGKTGCVGYVNVCVETAICVWKLGLYM